MDLRSTSARGAGPRWSCVPARAPLARLRALVGRGDGRANTASFGERGRRGSRWCCRLGNDVRRVCDSSRRAVEHHILAQHSSRHSTTRGVSKIVHVFISLSMSKLPTLALTVLTVPLSSAQSSSASPL